MDKSETLRQRQVRFAEIRQEAAARARGRVIIRVAPPQPAMAALLFYSRPTDRDFWLEA